MATVISVIATAVGKENSSKSCKNAKDQYKFNQALVGRGDMQQLAQLVKISSGVNLCLFPNKATMFILDQEIHISKSLINSKKSRKVNGL